jgi:hypothetical protein
MATAYVCLQHSNLLDELESLRTQYDLAVENAKNFANRIEETKDQLNEFTVNISQVYCDALDAFSVYNHENGFTNAGTLVLSLSHT